MAALWNPDQLLNITGSGLYRKVQCSGINKGNGLRCGFQKRVDDKDNMAIHRLLPSLAARPLSGITREDLLDLAELCLCRDWHYPQKHRLADDWGAEITQALARQQAAIAPPRLQTPEPPAPGSDGRPLGAFGMPTPPSDRRRSRPPSPIMGSPSNAPPSFYPVTPRDNSPSLQESISSLQADLSAARQELDNTRDALNNALNDLRDKNQQLGEKTEKLTEITQQLHEANKKMDQMQGLETWADNQAKAKALAEITNDELKRSLETQRQNFEAEIQRLRNKRDERVANLSRELKEEKQRSDSLQKDRDHARAEHAKASHSFTATALDKAMQAEEHANQTKAKDEELDRLKLELDQAKQALDEEKRQHGETRQARNRYEVQVRQLLASKPAHDFPVSHVTGKTPRTQVTEIGRELVLRREPTGKMSWMHRLRGWLDRLRPGHPGRVSMRHDVV